MSTINSSTDYSYLFNSTSGTSGTNKTSSTSDIYSLQNQLNSMGLYNTSGYGTNTSNLSESQAQGVIDFKTSAESLLSSVADLMGGKNDGNSVFTNYAATASDKDAFSATYKADVGKYSSEALAARRDPNYKASGPSDMAIKIDQIATKQVNKTASLANGEMALEAGKTYTFEVEAGGKKTNISFTTAQGDTNEDINKKLASAINGKDAGVSAKVMSDDVTGATYLKLEASETGIDANADRAFSIRDVSGDAASKLNLNNMTEEAQNAIIRVGALDKDASTDTKAVASGDVKTIESKSNTVDLDGRTSITAKKTTEDYAAITFENDATDGINAVRDLVNGFNSLLDNAQNFAGSNTAASRLQTQLQGLAKTYSNSLAEIGITQNSDGFLKIDSDKMQKAAENGSLQKMFSTEDANANYGFANRLKTIASSVDSDPTQYVKGKTTAKTSENSAAEDMWNDTSTTTNYSKLYFNMLRQENMGALFNSMF